MKLNLFKVEKENAMDLVVDLEDSGYEMEANHEDEHGCVMLYLKKNHSENQGWLVYYKNLLGEDIFNHFTENLGSESVSGAFLIETDEYTYVVAHGQAHFVVRKYCDKDFGLNLAERILDESGLKMKHSQTFTSASKKDITSYTRKRKLGDSCEYGEAFSYVKCKTNNAALWGETVDFGESVRFTFGKEFNLRPTELYQLMDRITHELAKAPAVTIPRYHKVLDKDVLAYLDHEFNIHMLDFLTDVDVEDYWLTGVSFSFTNDYRYSLRFRQCDLTAILDSLDANTVRKAVEDHAEQIGDRHDLIKVRFYNEEEEYLFYRPLKSMMQVTIEHDGKYYVFYQNSWFEFSESYVKYIEDQVDSIQFELKDATNKTETELIDELVATGQYVQLHKDNVYIGKYCIEKADLMDDNNIIMIKDQHQQADLVYLIKQATTSLRLSEAGELGENVFRGRNVCLWMLVDRKRLAKLSDFRSFHLLDALNDFKQEVTSKNLNPLIWVSLTPID